MTDAGAGEVEGRRRMLSETVHELRTPLAVILGHAELLAGGLPADAVVRSAEAIVSAAEALNDVLERRLDELRAVAGEEPEGPSA